MLTISKDELLSLKSGSDIRGNAVETGTEKVQLTDEVVSSVCTAFVRWYRSKYNCREFTVAVGHDSRISANRIKTAAVTAFVSEGACVYDCGLCATPAMFMAVVSDIKASASLEITASHHPYQKNGLKFFTPDGGLNGSDVTEILELAYDIEQGTKSGKVIKYDFMSVYSKHLQSVIVHDANCGDLPLKGLKISVDSGNGAGGFYAEKVLAPLGADVSASQFSEPDGMFPNHVPNPENKQAMESAQNMVLNSGSDLGIIFDTDVDRMGCVFSDGTEINRNRLVALASVIALKGNPGGTVVTDSLTSDGLRSFIENNLGGKQLRFKRGYKNVINKAVELNNGGINCPLAIETSGHAALRENYFLDDGAYLAAKIIALAAAMKKQGKDLISLLAGLKEPAESMEIRIAIREPDFKTYGESVINAVAEFADSRNGWSLEKENYEGVRVNFNGGWFLLRLSVHDPILPLNIECEEFGKANKTASELKEFLKKFDKLDLINFDKVQSC